LKAFLTAELGELRALPEATARDLTARLERVETALRGDVERAGNTLAAYIGELEERLERAGRASLPPSTQPR
jgi:phage-related protein